VYVSTIPAFAGRMHFRYTSVLQRRPALILLLSSPATYSSKLSTAACIRQRHARAEVAVGAVDAAVPRVIELRFQLLASEFNLCTFGLPSGHPELPILPNTALLPHFCRTVERHHSVLTRGPERNTRKLE